MTERDAMPADPQAAVLVCLDFGEPDYAEGVDELVRLVESAGVTRHCVVAGRRARPDPKLFAGQGKVEEIARAAEDLNAMCVVFNHDLSPAQERNLEKLLKRRVMDRTSVILDIFAQRAQTTEGKLQVELAQLEHLSTRLVRGWSHLERQRGGLGKTGGPGEKQIEIDRRLIGSRVRLLRGKLEQLRRRREVQRRARDDSYRQHSHVVRDQRRTDDRQVVEHRRQRRHQEVPPRVEDAHEHPADREQHRRDQHHASQLDGEIVQLRLAPSFLAQPGRQQRHQLRRQQERDDRERDRRQKHEVEHA